MFDVAHIAKLARIGLTKEEEKKFAVQLPAILDLIDKLKEVDVEGVKPTAQATGLQNVMRQDEAVKRDRQQRSDILANAPETKDGAIKVKAVFEL